MVSVVGVEWGDSCGGVLGIIIDEFGEGKELVPIILLIVTEDAEVLLEDLVYSFHLAIRLWMKGCRLVTVYLAKV